MEEGLGRAEAKPLWRLSLEKLGARVCEGFRVSENELCGPSRSRRTVEIRAVIGHLVDADGVCDAYGVGPAMWNLVEDLPT